MRQILITILLIASIGATSQEGQFSQYFSSWALTNPAFVGTIPNPSINTNYKRGGNEESGSFQELLQTTATYPLQKTTSRDFQIGGSAITFFRERRGFQGVYSLQKVLVTGAYGIRLSPLTNQSVIFALQGGVGQYRIDGQNLTWGSQYNKYIGFDGALSGEQVASDLSSYPIINFGVLYSTYDNENYYVRDKSLVFGISIDNLNKPLIRSSNLGEVRRDRVFKAFGSLKVPFASRWYAHPSGYFLLTSGAEQINAGVLLSTDLSSPRSNTDLKIQVGSWYRVGDSMIVLGGFQVQNFKIGASFDLNTQTFGIDKLLGNNQPTFEISLSYILLKSGKFKNVSSPIF
jgi:type IX secretion system PorP/SprF family membrane protein